MIRGTIEVYSKSGAYDLVFMDVQMSRMDGYEEERHNWLCGLCHRKGEFLI